MSFVEPFRNEIIDPVYFFFKIMYQVILCIVNVQVVDHENATTNERLRDGADSIIMFPGCFKISKACKEVKCVVEVIYPEGQSHIMAIEVQVWRFIFQSFRDAVLT